MEQPLQPGAAQKPADEGLFDVAGRGQLDLVDLAKQALTAPEGPYSGLTPTLPWFAKATGIERPKGRYAGSINLDRLNTPEEIKRAIEDYTATLRLKPDYASALNNRGVAWHKPRMAS